MIIRATLQHFCTIAILSMLYPFAISANQSPPPAPSKSLLSLHWIDAQGHINQHRFNLKHLEALPQSTLTLELPKSLGIPGPHRWQGVSLGDLLKLSGNTGQSIRLQALNGYYVTLPTSDIERYNPLLAYRRGDNILSVREKGPFILIYPFHKFRTLNQQLYINRSIWQVHEIHIE